MHRILFVLLHDIKLVKTVIESKPLTNKSQGSEIRLVERITIFKEFKEKLLE